MKKLFWFPFLIIGFLFTACSSITDDSLLDLPDLDGLVLVKSQDSLIVKPGSVAGSSSTLIISDPEFLVKLLAANSPPSPIVKLQNLTVLVTSPDGIRIPSNISLDLSGTTLQVSTDIRSDGNVFWGRNIRNVRILNGRINGNRDFLPDHVNIAGIFISGASSEITISGMTFSDLSSNGIRISGVSESQPVTSVTIQNCVFTNNCNKYNDYLDPNVGPVKGTTRDDQGAVKLSNVNQFLVKNCSLNGAKSDGTHFFKSSNGEISQNQIINNKMGGLFLEGCTGVKASGNFISDNGSRGVTVERGSSEILLSNNQISKSGREGCWIDDTKNMVVTGNLFRLNGRKADVDRTYQIKFTDTSWPLTPLTSKTSDILISKNKFNTDKTQVHAIKISSACRSITISGNEFRGEIRSIRPDCYTSGVGSVSISGNDGWITENSGRLRLLSLFGKTSVEIPHGLQVFDPTLTQAMKQLVVEVKIVRPVADPAAIRFTMKTDLKKLVFTDIFISDKLNLSSELEWTATLVSK